MVKLDIISSADKQSTPFLHQWDTEYRKNHHEYQEQIDRHTFHLQKSQRGWGPFGSWLYPNLFQRDFLKLHLLKQKQIIGRIFPEEVASYETVNLDIRSDLQKVFNTGFYRPWRGLGAGAIGVLATSALSASVGFRLGALVVPIAIDYVAHWSDTSAWFRSRDFLNWLIEYRKARAQIEYDGGHLYQENSKLVHQFKHQTKNSKSVYDIYEQLVDLISHEREEAI